MNATPQVRERQVNVRLSEDEAERLEVVCRHYGLNGANLFRMLVQREYNALGPPPPAPAPAPARKPTRSKK
jgi:hypothetical protein